VLSPAIVDEVLRALGYRKVRRLLRGADAQLWFEDLVVLADVVADRDAPRRLAPRSSLDACRNCG